MYAEYKKNPTITKQRMFYEAMEDVLPDLKVIIESGSGNLQEFLPIDSFAQFNVTQTTPDTSTKEEE